MIQTPGETHGTRKPERPAGGWTIGQFAADMQVHPVTVKRWIRRGLVRVVRVGKRSVRIVGLTK